MVRQGWYQVAFATELVQALTAAAIEDTPLVLVQSDGVVRAVDARCPHRGANLGLGGRLEGEAIVCPFHGHRVHLGTGTDGDCVREYPCLVRGGLIFVRLSADHDHGLANVLEKEYGNHDFLPAFTVSLRAPVELVAENGFDAAHFKTVHGIYNEPEFRALPSVHGELGVSGEFAVPTIGPGRQWTPDRLDTIPYRARAFSPGLVLSDLGNSRPYSVLTGITPTLGGGCALRMTLLVPQQYSRYPGNEEVYRRIIQESRAGIDKDRVIWEGLSPPASPRLTPRDASVLAFQEFCRTFTSEPTLTRPREP